MHAFTNIYEVPIWVVGHLWRSLHSTVTNVRYAKGCVFYEGERIICCFLWALSEVQALQWWFDRIIQLYSQTILAQTLNMWHPSLSGHEDKWEKWEREIDFIDRLLQFTWIHLVTDNLSLGIFEKLNFCYIISRKKPYPRHRRMYVTCKYEKQRLKGVSCVG